MPLVVSPLSPSGVSLTFSLCDRPPVLSARTSRDQLETLYEARGHEIGRLRADLERQRTEAAAELRACRHQATLTTADGQGLQTSLQQARQLLGKIAVGRGRHMARAGPA